MKPKSISRKTFSQALSQIDPALIEGAVSYRDSGREEPAPLVGWLRPIAAALSVVLIAGIVLTFAFILPAAWPRKPVPPVTVGTEASAETVTPTTVESDTRPTETGPVPPETEADPPETVIDPPETTTVPSESVEPPVTFPHHTADKTAHNAAAFEITPFTARFSLPQGWVLRDAAGSAPDGKLDGAEQLLSDMDILNEAGETVGKIGYNVFDESGLAYPSEPRAIYNQIALGNHLRFLVGNDTASGDDDEPAPYEVVKTHAHGNTAVTDVYYSESYMADYIDAPVDVCNPGILSFDTELKVYVGFEFDANKVDRDTVRSIAESLTLTAAEAPTTDAPETTPPVTTPAETTPIETTPAVTTPAETAPIETTPADTELLLDTKLGDVLGAIGPVSNVTVSRLSDGKEARITGNEATLFVSAFGELPMASSCLDDPKKAVGETWTITFVPKSGNPRAVTFRSPFLRVGNGNWYQLYEEDTDFVSENLLYYVGPNETVPAETTPPETTPPETTAPVTTPTGSKLSFTLSSDKKSYVVSGIGEHTDFDLTIPSTYNGKPVTAIADYAFVNSRVLDSVVIPDSVQTIGDWAFANCPYLNRVEIGNGVTKIGSRAFSNTVLTAITLPNNVTELGVGAFSGCSKLMVIKLPDRLTDIADETFRDCSALPGINLPTALTSIGVRAFYGCKAMREIAIPESLRSIGQSAFVECTKLSDVKISDLSIWCRISFDKGVFSPHRLILNGTNVTDLVIPDGITKISDYVFASCSEIRSVTIPNGLTEISESAFSFCTGMKSITIPNTVKKIGNSAFHGCRDLTSITIPNSVTEIGEEAFAYCTGLTSITISDNVTRIGASAFSSCTSLTSFTFSKQVQTVEEGIFYRCGNLTDVTIPEGVTIIGKDAFMECSGLKTISLPNSLKSIGDDAFHRSGLTSITIPNSVTTVERGAFSGCAGLTSAVLSDHLTALSDLVFCGTGLTEITIPDSVAAIESGAFSICASLTKVTFGTGLTRIGDRAFADCTALTEMEIPNGVTSIGQQILRGCSSLTSVMIPRGVKTIGQSSFSECECLTTVVIPDGVTFIGPSAFAHCYALKEIVIPDSVTFIGPYAFELCYALKEIAIPDSVVGIDSSAFAYSGLTSLSLPNSLQSLELSLFEGCKDLTDVFVPAGVSYVSDFVFDDCPQLHSITFGGTRQSWNAMAKGKVKGITVHCSDGDITG